MPATKTKPAKPAVAPAKMKKGKVEPAKLAKASRKAAAPVAAPAPVKRKAKAAPAVPEMSERSAAISAAMLELADVRTAARAKRGGVPAKHVLFLEWFKALLAGKPFDLDAAAKRFPEVKATTIKAWRNKWRNGRLPSNGRDKAQQIAKLVAKGAVA